MARQVVESLLWGGWQITVRVTNAADDVAEVAASMTDPYVGAVGGDGYLARVAEGLRNQKPVLIPFPGGRGNDLCHSLGIGSDYITWADTLAAADDEEVHAWQRPLDAMIIKDQANTKFALGIVSLGVDATANVVANDLWVKSGPLTYGWGAVTAFLGRYKRQKFTGKIDGETADMGAWLCSVSNTGWFGGGTNILPQSHTDDGLLELMAIDDLPRRKVLPLLYRALSRKEISDPAFKVVEGTRFVIEEPAGYPAYADGDLVGHLPLDIGVAANALTIVAPPQNTDSLG